MTDPVLTWELTADTQTSMEVGGVTFDDVVTNVHWRLYAEDPATGEFARDYGSQHVPPPTSAEDFIDISTLTGMSDTDKRATVLGWAEAVAPGFVAEKEAKVAAMLAEQQAAPATGSVDIL